MKIMMKMQISCLAVVYLIVGFSLYSCQQGNGSVRDFHLAQADEILRLHNANLPEFEKVTKQEGNVTITATKYLTTIDFEPDNSNEVFSYFLQVEDNETNLLSVPSGRAEVLFFDRHLIVNSLVTKRILYFKIKTDPKPDYLESLGDIKEYTGYGMGMRKVTKGTAMESAPFCSCISMESKQWNCPYGGMGSLSCSTGNDFGICKINCSGQTFPCCDPRDK